MYAALIRIHKGDWVNIGTCNKNQAQRSLSQSSTSTCCWPSWMAAITKIHKSSCHHSENVVFRRYCLAARIIFCAHDHYLSIYHRAENGERENKTISQQKVELQMTLLKEPHMFIPTRPLITRSFRLADHFNTPQKNLCRQSCLRWPTNCVAIFCSWDTKLHTHCKSK